MKGNYLIRRMKKSELDIALGWAAKEGWNPGLYDAECFYHADPNGFFIGLLDGIPISCISAVSYNQHFGFLGLYLVKPDYRGFGYGIRIWNRAIGYLKTQNIGLDGVVNKQENYKKSGFKLAYRNIRYQGKSGKSKSPDSSIIELSQVPFNQLLKYDSSLFPSSRPQFLKCWINQPESFSLGCVNRGKLAGYGVIRKCRQGYKVGPLFADNRNTAEKLFSALNNSLAPKSTVFLDTPEINTAALELAKKYGMKKCFETARMYTKVPPIINFERVYGVTSFELG